MRRISVLEKAKGLKIEKLAAGLMCFGLVASASSCGKNPASQIVSNVGLTTSTQGNDDWIQAKMTLNTGGFNMVGLDLPVMNPINKDVYGRISLIPGFCGQGCTGYSTEFTVAVNLTQVSQQPGTVALLPNGTPLPVGGLQGATTLAIPIENTGAVLYFAFGKGVAMLGAAVPFKALDPAGQYVPGLNIFQPIPAGPVQIIAGMFTGAQTNTTGVGVFMDLSTVFNNANINARSLAMANIRSLAANRAGQIQSVLVMKGVQNQSTSKVNQFYSRVYDMSKKNITLDARQ